MQTEAIAESVRILKEHERSESGGLPVGQARGKVILPCGTGKTRISLRIVEALTPPGGLSIVLCPSIALVAQIRREYLQHAETAIRALAVCSDETAGYDPRKEGAGSAQDDPTLDRSNVSASEVKGKVTTDAAEIADWIRQGQDKRQTNVIFGTYQSSHRVGEALRNAGTAAAVLVADEAHRTAGLRRNKKLEERLRDFTVCHDNDRFPVKYRIYQTATPRVYDTSGNPRPRNPDWVVRNMDDETVFGMELYRKSYMEAVTNGWLADYRIIALGVNDPDAFAAANALASTTAQTGLKNTLTTTHFLKGMTLGPGAGRRHYQAERRQRQREVLHLVHEHRRQIQGHGATAAIRHRAQLGAEVAGRQPQRPTHHHLHPGASRRHQQRQRPRPRQEPAGTGRCAQPARHRQRRHLRRRHRLAVAERRGLPRSPEKPH